jgi:hypothetical protein
LVLLLPMLATAQLRVATWNISNFGGGRTADIQTVVFDSFEGRSMQPDILVCEEVLSSAAQSSMLAALNSAPGSSGTWSAAPFTDGPDTDMAMFYRTDRLQLLASTVISHGGSSPLPPRDTKRYDVRLLGYGTMQPKLAIYGTHLKAGNTSNDMARRLAEATIIRNDAQTLSGFDGFAVLGDFNVYSSSDDAYVKLTGFEGNNAGRCFDPISTPGAWDNTSSFRFVHTQDPSNNGMDSRFDFVLLSSSLRDGDGFDYLGNPNLPYSDLTWNDGAHSYRAWGNDGTSFNLLLTVIDNEMVGPAIAQAIRNAATSAGGHIPVFLDLIAPAEIGTSAATLDFGTVVEGSAAARSLTVSNTTSTSIWRTGIAPLLYGLVAPSGFEAPSGSFSDLAGGSGNGHSISMDTTTAGVKSGNLVVQSPVAGTNSVAVSLHGQVVPDELRPESMTPEAGTSLSGPLGNLFSSDNQRVDLRNAGWAVLSRGEPALEVTLDGTSPVPSVNSITLRLESQTNGFSQEVAVWNRTTEGWQTVDTRFIGTADTPIEVIVPNPGQVLDPATGRLSVRLRYFPKNPGLARIAQALIDKAVWVLR